jgi:hypothetical protein
MPSIGSCSLASRQRSGVCSCRASIGCAAKMFVPLYKVGLKGMPHGPVLAVGWSASITARHYPDDGQAMAER